MTARAVVAALNARIAAGHAASPSLAAPTTPAIVRHLDPLRSSGGVGDCLRYIAGADHRAREENVDLFRIGGQASSLPDALARVAEWTAKTRSTPIARHFVFSVARTECRETDGIAPYGAASRALRDAVGLFSQWGHDGYAALHHDTDNVHLHALVHWRRPEGSLLPIGPDGLGLDALRVHLAEAARRFGLSTNGLRAVDREDPKRAAGQLRYLVGKHASLIVDGGGDPAAMLARLAGRTQGPAPADGPPPAFDPGAADGPDRSFDPVAPSARHGRALGTILSTGGMRRPASDAACTEPSVDE